MASFLDEDLPPDLAVKAAMLKRQQDQLDREGKLGLFGAMRQTYRQPDLDQQMQAFVGEYQKALQDAVSKYRQTSQGNLSYGPNYGPQSSPDDAFISSGVGGDKLGAIREALLSNFGPLKKIATADYDMYKKENEPYTLTQGSQRMQGPTMVAENPPEFKPTEPRTTHSIPDTWQNDIPKGRRPGPTPGTFYETDGDLMQMEYENNKLKGVRNVNPLPRDSAGRGTVGSNIKEVEDPDQENHPGRMLLVDVAKYKPGGKIGSPGVLGVAKSESKQGGREAARRFKMEGTAADLQEAEDILSGIKRDEDGNPQRATLPTGSMIGKGVDFLGRVVGATPAGAEEAAQLKVVANRLVQRIPRFEGPQSNFDAKLYVEAAAQAGDDTQTRATRLKAVQTMRKLYAKYERGEGGNRLADKPTSPPTAAGGPKKGDKSKSKSGKSITFDGTRWVYD